MVNNERIAVEVKLVPSQIKVIAELFQLGELVGIILFKGIFSKV
jgi:hypothetical protein